MYLFAVDDLHEHPDRLDALFTDYATCSTLIDVAKENEKAVKLLKSMLIH